MFSGGKKWIKKMLKRCYSFSLYLLSLFFVLCLSYANASAWSPDSFNVRFNIHGYNNDEPFMGRGYELNEVIIVGNVYGYEWVRDSQVYNGNYVNIHFETNIVQSQYMNGVFHLDDISIAYCGSGGSNGNIRSQSIRTYKTSWVGITPVSPNNDVLNITATIIGDVVVTGLPTSGTHDLYCGLAIGGGVPFLKQTTPAVSNDLNHIYFEQQPSSVTFTNDESEALIRQQNAILNNINNSIQNINSDYDKEKSDLQDKEDELDIQSGDLSLNADILSNPFSSLFWSNLTNYTTCYTTSTIHNLFNASPMRFCPIIKSGFGNIYPFVANAVVVAILIRLYYKKLKGGRDG